METITGYDGEGNVLWEHEAKPAGPGLMAVSDHEAQIAHKIVHSSGKVLKDRSGPAPRC